MDEFEWEAGSGLVERTETRWDNDKRGLVVQDNVLVRAAYTMPLMTKRLFLLAASKINSETWSGKNNVIGVTITADEWGETYSGGRKWRELKAAAQDLMKRQVTLNPTKEKKYRRVINICDSTDYWDGLGRCDIRFSYSISTLMSGMLEEFTKMDLLNVSKFTSRNTIRLYELLSQMRTAGKTQWWLKISVHEFRLCMGFSEKQYTRTAELKRAVIDKSIDEINTRSDLLVDVEYIKQGRQITTLLFTYRENDQLNLFVE